MSKCEFIPYKTEHAVSLLTDPEEKKFYSDGLGRRFEITPGCVSIVNDGVLMCCGGVVELWPNRAMVWIIFNINACKKSFVPVFRAIKKYLDGSKFERIEMYIPFKLEFAERRAELLGFEMECPFAAKFLPKGQDASIYVKVRH